MHYRYPQAFNVSQLVAPHLPIRVTRAPGLPPAKSGDPSYKFLSLINKR